jgi:molybdate transport system regulatory protein
MNTLVGKIEKITVSGSLSLVSIMVEQTLMNAIVIDTPQTAPYLYLGNTVNVIFKETEVIIGKGTQHHISLQNKLTGNIKHLESGELLSKLILETSAGKVISIITTNAVNNLQLKEGSEITAMIKTNEIMLSE